MRDADLQLLVRIEEALTAADESGAIEVALHLDRARIAAGGSGEIDPKWFDRLFLADQVTSSQPGGNDGACVTATA